MKRVVVDPNVLLSALVGNPEASPAIMLEAPTNGEVISAAGKFGEAVGGVAVEGAEALGHAAGAGLETVAGVVHYAAPIVVAGVCLTAAEACETAVAGNLVVETASGLYDVLSDPSGVLQRLRHMSVVDYVSGLDETLVLAGPALAAVELRATEAALQAAARPGYGAVLVC